MWRSLFLHEIPNGDLRNFAGVAGSVSLTSFQLDPAAIAPGQEFEFTLQTPMGEVIGVSCRIRLHKPIAGSEVFRIMRAGTDVEFLIQKLDNLPANTPELSISNKKKVVIAAKYRADLRIGPNLAVPIGVLVLPHRRYAEIRFDWHTSGQARLLQNGQLVGYHNAVAPGTTVSIPSVAFGRSDRQLGSAGSRYGVARFFVRALRRSDALGILSLLLPDLPVTEDPMLARCRERAFANLLATADALRPFMSLAHKQLSSPWNSVTGDPQGPFSKKATTAHRLALLAGASLVQMLRRSDFEHPEAFLAPFEDLLRTLHDALPKEFETLAQTLLNSSGQLEECNQLLADDRLAHGASMQPVFELLREAGTIVQRVSGGQ